MPDQKLDQFIKFCIQNSGHLSSTKRDKFFSMLKDAEIKQFETVVQNPFGLGDLSGSVSVQDLLPKDLTEVILDPMQNPEKIGVLVAQRAIQDNRTRSLETDGTIKVIDNNPKLALQFPVKILNSLIKSGRFENIHFERKIGGTLTQVSRLNIEEGLSGSSFGIHETKSKAFKKLAADILPRYSSLFFLTEGVEQPISASRYGISIAILDQRLISAETQRATWTKYDTGTTCHPDYDDSSRIANSYTGYKHTACLKNFDSYYHSDEPPYKVQIWGRLSLADVEHLYFDCGEWKKIKESEINYLRDTGIPISCYNFSEDTYPGEDNWAVTRWVPEIFKIAQIEISGNAEKRREWAKLLREKLDKERMELIIQAKKEMNNSL